MKKASAKPKAKARAPRTRTAGKRRGGAAKAKAALIRTVRGEDEQGNPYRKDFYKGRTVTTYGSTLPPSPARAPKDASKEELLRHLEQLDQHDEDESEAIRFADKCCYLVRRQKVGQPATWSFYGPDVTLLRGDVAKGTFQGRWNKPESMALLRALESHRDHPERETDAATVRDAMFARQADFDAALRATREGGLVRYGDLPRPWRIAQAVVEAARIHNRPPSVSEAFHVFGTMERTRGAGVGQTSADRGNFARDLKAAGWGWLAAAS